jgi:hypothetical protein
LNRLIASGEFAHRGVAIISLSPDLGHGLPGANRVN